MTEILYPSNNEYGIPRLDPALQVERVSLPYTAWGSRSRAEVSSGFHFYVDDYRFQAILKDPFTLPRCDYVVEPNISILPNTPLALALGSIYRKRWVAASWQSMGYRVAVDLNVPYSYRAENLIGVPKGWKAYATRAYADRLDQLDDEYNTAVSHAQSNRVLVLVVGGGKAAKEHCHKLPGAVHLQDKPVRPRRPNR
jgi:hypothetical protein